MPLSIRRPLHQRRTCRLFLEPLEDRRLLATMHAVDDSVSTSMNLWVEFGVLGNDYTDTQGPFWVDEYGQPSNGSLSEGVNGSFMYTPNLGFSGTDSFWYVAEDGDYNSGMATVTIEVTSADDFYSTSSGTQLTVAAPGVLANDYDPDGYPYPASLVSGTAYGSLNLNTDGGFTYTPSGPFVTDSFTYSSGAGTSTVTITNDDTPTAHGDSYTINVGVALNVSASGVLANDTGVGALSAALVDPPASGLLDLQGDGSFTYESQAGFRGVISFSYTASDGTLTSSPAVVTIRVNAVPQAANDSLGTTEDTPLTLYAPGILGNDTDADGDALAAIYASGPIHGVLTLHTDGSFTYTPDLNYNGSDDFSYRASDGLDESDAAVVSISMSAANDAPVASNETYSTPQDTPLDVSYPGVLANDDDAEDNYLTAVLVTGPAHGALTLSPLGGFYYTPAAGYYGADSFTYRAQDAALQSAPATVTITVQQAFAPIAQPNSYYTDIDTPLTTGAPQAPTVLANDYDPNGNALIAVLAAGPAHGTFTLNPNGHFTYTPAAGFHGLDSFTYRAQDTGGLLSPPALVSLTVGPDLQMGTFKSDGDQSQFTYLVRGPLAGSYEIGVYASPDGVTLGQLLQSTPGRTEAGPHNHYLPPQFNDPGTDYYLIVKLDSQESLTEASEDNNWRRFDGGSFLVTQPASGDTELHAHGLDSNDAFFASQDNGVVTLSSSLQFQDEEYTAANFTAIRLRPHGGHDTAAIDTALTKPAWLFGGAGGDSLNGGSGNDRLFGGLGDDWLYANAGNDFLDGSDDIDNMFGGVGNDTLLGGAGDDWMSGDADNDLLLGDADNDTALGGDGDDILDGGAGNDNLQSGPGNDRAFGGAGNNSISSTGGSDEQYPDGTYGGQLPTSITLTLEPPGNAREAEGFIIRGRVSPAGQHRLGGTVTSMYSPGFPVETDADGKFEVSSMFADDGPVLGNGTSSDVENLTMSVYLIDAPTVTATATTTVTVHNEPPKLYLWMENGDLHGVVDEQGPAVVAPDRQTITINWGDGSSDVISNWLPGEEFILGHEYENPTQAHTISVEAVDDDGGSDTETCSTDPARTVTGLSSSKGSKFWEGDTVTFTASLSSPTPGANESFAWEWRRITGMTQTIEGGAVFNNPVYGNWEPLPGGVNAPVATDTFGEPFEGQVRVTLTSDGHISSRTIDVRAQAAHPVDFRMTSFGKFGSKLRVYYAWSSSSSRLADLDGVLMGEFVWQTWMGRWIYPPETVGATFPLPPFGGSTWDGFYIEWPEGAAASGAGMDTHGAGQPLVGGAAARVAMQQYYYYKIADGAYNDPPPSHKEKFRFNTITYEVSAGMGGTWILTIDKGSDGSAQWTITTFPFPQ